LEGWGTVNISRLRSISSVAAVTVAQSQVATIERATRQVVANNAVLAVQYAVSALVPILLVPHIVRSIGVESYGRIAVAAAWAGLGSVVVQYAFQLTGLKRVAQTAPGESSSVAFAEVFLAKLLLLACVSPALVIIALSVFARNWVVLQLVVLLALPLASALNSGWYLQARGRFAAICLISIAATAAAMWVGFTQVSGAETASVWGAAVATILGPVLAGVVTLLAAWNLTDRDFSIWRTARPLHALRDGWLLFLSQVVAALYGVSGTIIISILAGVADAGTYSVVERFINAVIGGCLLTHTAAYPRLAAVYVHDKVAYRKLMRFVTTVYLSVAISIAVGAWVFREPLLHFLLGGNLAQGTPLVACSLLWLILGFFGTAVTGYLTVSGRSQEVMLLTIKVLAVSVTLGVPGVMLLGGWAWMASLLVGQIPVLVVAYRSWRELRAS
jgi:O-antigen/teichoic acid export membrane protein